MLVCSRAPAHFEEQMALAADDPGSSSPARCPALGYDRQQVFPCRPACVILSRIRSAESGGRMSRADEELIRRAFEQRHPGIKFPEPRSDYLIDIEGYVYKRRSSAGGWVATRERKPAAATVLRQGRPVYLRKAVTGQPLYEDPNLVPPIMLITPLPQPQPVLPTSRGHSGCAWFLVVGVIAAVVAVVIIVRLNAGSDVPGDVYASSTNDYDIQVSWTDSSNNVAGFNIDNGCPVGACGGHGITLAKTVGHVTSATFSVTPGTYQCFRVQAILSSGVSGWSGYGCASTSGFLIDGTRAWIRTGVILKRGDQLYIKASGQISFGSSGLADPSGDPSCTSASDFPAPRLRCLSLIARIGHGHPFAVGTSAVATGHGRLYLGVNAVNFSDSSGGWIVNTKTGVPRHRREDITFQKVCADPSSPRSRKSSPSAPY